MKFKVGDKVKSSPDSSDVRGMKAIWVARVTHVVGENDAGGCFETLGHWEPIKNKNGEVSSFWKEQDDLNDPTRRQLWGEHLVKA